MYTDATLALEFVEVEIKHLKLDKIYPHYYTKPNLLLCCTVQPAQLLGYYIIIQVLTGTVRSCIPLLWAVIPVRRTVSN